MSKCESDAAIRKYVTKHLGGHWDEYRRYIHFYGIDELCEAVMSLSCPGSNRDQENLPSDVKDMILELLGIESGESVGDFSAGTGDFLCHASAHSAGVEFYGVENDSDSCALARMRAAVCGSASVHLEQGDIFASGVLRSRKFHKCFCHPVLGQRLGRMANGEEFLRTQSPALPKITGQQCGEWLYALKMLSCLKEGGRGVLVMPAGALSNRHEGSLHNYFCSRGLIEAVVKLPGKVVASGGHPAALVVFGRRVGNYVTMINASEMIPGGSLGGSVAEQVCALLRKIREHKITFSEENRVKFENTVIIPAMQGGEVVPQAGLVDFRDICVRGNMDPAYFLRDNGASADSIPFKTVIREIYRGALIGADELKSLLSEEPTSCRYLAPGSIQNGVISEELPYLDEDIEQYQRYCVDNGALVISKVGSPFKVALAEVPQGTTMIANGNVFVININTKYADAWYLKAFLESSRGQELLARSSVGSAAPVLNLEALKELPISLPELQEQQRIGSAYQEKMAEIARLQQSLKEAMSSLKKILG
ncbi:MAG: N-6 DNA methylase [Victivallales bacterium]|nr:N-6 DNA methylase [Victivallales bacterium]